jgi:isocitrate dehydrogenase kinase/phosphatase
MSTTSPTTVRALATEAINFAALADLWSAKEPAERARIVAGLIFAVFEDYYQRSRRIPFLAKAAFETRDWPTSFRLSKDRLSIYSLSIAKLAPMLAEACPELKNDDTFWATAERHYLELIKGRYEADLAFAFVNSVHRKIFADEWKPVAYSYGDAAAPRQSLANPVLLTFESRLPIDPAVVRRILDIPGFTVPWRDIDGDARLVAAEIDRALAPLDLPADTEVRLVMANAGFFRNRGAYITGRMSIPGHGLRPLLVALLNNPQGIFADAVLTDSDELQYVFSTTLANFHATNPHYHELAQLLFSLMPKRALGLHYSTIGFNHVGKVAVINEIAREQRRTGERLDTAVGFRGTVAIGFSMPSSRYVMKVIRDKPTAGYKWGSFPGLKAVMAKYRLVHNHDRAGSMLDNIIYYNIRLDRDWFAPDLLDELSREASETVAVQGGDVVFKSLIVQAKLIPLPVFLETASREDALAAVINLGDCIKNNAAADIFNKDLDGRNYGVSGIRKVYLFDYDAVEPLTGVKVRTNTGRVDGEEDIPEWYFEEGTIFLPEEMMVGLRIDDRELRRAFQQAHPELMSVEYWEGMQRALREGKLPKVRAYPVSRRIDRSASPATSVHLVAP